MTKDEALKLALEALTNAYWPTDSDLLPAHNIKECGEAITAIKAALEAKDEPWEQFYPEMGKPKFMEVQDGECKYCTDGCPACDARKLPEREPVGEIVDAIERAFKCSFTKMLPVGTKLYTTPPQRKPLTDEEIQDALLGYRLVDAIDIVRAIESAHGIKG
jgi:hypothetical protein